MLDFSTTELNEIAVHKVDNKANDEDLICAKSLLFVDDAINQLLKKYFLTPFKKDDYFVFHHETDLNLNEVYHYLSEIFEDPDRFYINSVNLAKHLYEKAEHPKIKGGEFYVTFFQSCVVDGEVCEAIGLFKSENKDTYIKVFNQQDAFEVSADNGVNINKLDKGCIVFNTEKDKGYKLVFIDNTNKGAGNEAHYWKDAFLQIKQREDNFYHTSNFLDLCKTFVDEHLEEVVVASKHDQIIIKENAFKYFEEKEVFNIEEFQNEALAEPIVIEAFNDYKNTFFQTREIETFDEFDISDKAVKKAQKQFKSILKLDKNFHIYIHGRHDLMEKGYDEDQRMNYYKLYFLKEE